MEIEERLPQLMREAVPDVGLRVEGLVAGAVDRGRRRRRRRRLRSGLESVLVVVLLALPIAAAGYVLRARPDGPSTASQPAVAESPAADRAPVGPEAVARTLVRLLSSTGRVSDVRSTTSSIGESVGTVGYDDGRGPAAVSAVVSVRKAGATAAGAGEWSCAGDPAIGCTARTLPDGSVLVTRQHPAPGTVGTASWSATVGRPDGTVVSVREWNSARAKGAPAGRTHPPLSLDRLVSIATDPDW